jgi:8-oxo-dGTP pyrophosphatase MutT (NUDIX family)
LNTIMRGLGWLGVRLLITVKALLSPTALGVVGLVFDDRGRVLLVRHGYMTGWSLPGGGVDRGEPPENAVARELQEEIGLSGGDAVFAGLYTRRTGWATNVIAVYRITRASVNFRPSWEIREILWVDPAQPPTGTTPGTLRRLAEIQGSPVSPYW